MARRKSFGRSTGRIDKSAPTLFLRAEKHRKKVDSEVHSILKSAQDIQAMYDLHKQEFTLLKATDPDNPRIRTLNILVNSLAIALNDQTAQARKVRGTRHQFC